MKKLILVLVAMILVGCSAQCPPQDKIQEFQTQFTNFGNEINIANNTATTSLTPVLEKLQSIKSDFNKIDVPDCMNQLKGLMGNFYDEVINQITNLMGGGIVSSVNEEMYKTQITDELTRLNNCFPNCK